MVGKWGGCAATICYSARELTFAPFEGIYPPQNVVTPPALATGYRVSITFGAACLLYTEHSVIPFTR